MFTPLPTDAVPLIVPPAGPGPADRASVPAPAPALPPPLAALADALAGAVPVQAPDAPGTPDAPGPSAASVPATGSVLVATPRTPDEVALVIRGAREHGVRVAVRGRARSSGAALDGAVLVSTAALDHLTVLPVAARAHVGAGVTWDALVAAAARFGLAPVDGRTLSAGAPPDVAVPDDDVPAVDVVTGDDMVAVDVVTGDGVLRRATATEERELFAAVRRGRGAPGVVVAVEVRLAERAAP